MRIERDINKPQRRDIIKYRDSRTLSSTPEEAVYRNLFPGRNFEQRTNEQMDAVQKWIEDNSPGWNSRD
jgi:hypothetical protein